MMLEVGETQEGKQCKISSFFGDLGDKDVGPETRYTWYDVPLMRVTVTFKELRAPKYLEKCLTWSFSTWKY